jgi:hypothetical protein
MKNIWLIWYLFVSQVCFSQAEGNFWYFGQNAGIDFNSGVAVALSDGAMSTFEGCASISDNNGNLLFYTDGTTVYNANHLAMPNGTGLMGNSSSSQSAIIVQKPGNANIYVIFTIDVQAGANGLRYSEVDMTLQGGLGDINAVYNVPVYAPTCEKVAAVAHQNGTDFWIVSHEYGSSAFRSYLLSSSGLSATPIISNAGLNVLAFPGGTYSVGYLRANPSGTKIAVTHYFQDTLEILDFDNATGQVSNPLSIPLSTCYGIEFSPNEQFLYATSQGPDNVVQYDLTAGTVNDIINSQVSLHQGAGVGELYAALQMAPDGKIYCTYGIPTLATISSPDVAGLGCNFNISGFPLAQGTSGHYGLPTFQNNIISGSSAYNICQGESITLQNSNFQNHNWALASSPTVVFSTDTAITVSPSTSTTYILYDGQDTAKFIVAVSPPINIDLGPDKSLCNSGTVILANTTALTGTNLTYLWQDGSTNDTLLANLAGLYWLEVSNGGCTDRDTIFVNNFVGVDILPNNPICFGTPTGSIIANVTGGSGNTFVFTDDQGNVINPNGTNVANNLLAGTYYLEVIGPDGCGDPTPIVLVDPPAIQLTLSLTNPPCYGDATGGATVSNIINYQGDINDIFYNWTPNTSGANGLGVTNLPNLTAGDYNIQVVDDFGCEVSQVFSIIDPNPLVGEVTDIIPTMCRTADFQSGNGVVAVQTAPGSAGTGSVNYAWEHLTNGQTVNTSTFVVRSPGQVALTITDGNGCIYRDTVQVDSINPISNFLIESDDFTGPADREGTEDVKVKITNLSENFAQANNPNSDTIFQWNLFSNQLPSADQNWFFTYDLDQKVDTTYQGEQIYKICLIAKNYNDCADTFCQEVIVHKIPQLITPNVFTPGSSPNNTFFFPSASIADFNCTVFNRYGVQVYEFKAITDEWDGSHYKSGNPCSDGTYFYVYKALSTNGTPFEGEGQVQLVGSE